MKAYKPIFYLFQAVTIGLAVAFLLLLLKPDLLERDGKVVQFIEATGAKLPQSGPLSYADAVEMAAPAVVNIYTQKTVIERGNTLFDDPVFRHFFGDRFSSAPSQREVTSLGSGVIVNPEGYILTNNHVVDEAEAIQVTLHDGRNAAATVVGTDKESDLAVLKIHLDNLPTIVLGQADQLRVGDVVMAIGNPFGVGQTVTLGIVSATGRSELGITTFENFIQTDAAINPGNSGGALITARGELVGINTAIFSRTGGSQGIGFAIPMSLAKGVMQQIVEHGRVQRGWLGIEIQEVTAELAESFGLEEQQGIIVAGVLHDGPADAAGIQPGDIIIEINDNKIDSAHDALNAIAVSRPGVSIDIKALRNNQAISFQAKVTERPQQ